MTLRTAADILEMDAARPEQRIEASVALLHQKTRVLFMERLRQYLTKVLRHGARLVTLPFLSGQDEILVGGQAVIEGVMMRSPHAFAVAVRKPDSEIAVFEGELQRPSERWKAFKYPLLRGLGTLGQAMLLGVKALRFSAEQAVEDRKPESKDRKPELNNWVLAANLAFSLGFFIVFYKFLPLWLATRLGDVVPAAQNTVVLNLTDGIIRILLFLAFLAVIAQWKEIARVFEYHGAEHKAVWAFEKTGRIDLESARASTRFHPRCGTSFLLVVMVIAMLIYAFLPAETFAGRFFWRVALLPVIAGVSYEFVRVATRSRGLLWRLASQPGLWLQRITTREPDDGQLETALHALDRAMELERTRGGELVIA